MVDWSPLWLSIQTALLATALVSVSGTLAGWLVFRWQHPGRAWLDGFLTLPLVLPPTVTGFLLLLAFGNASPLGRALAAWGLPVVFTWGATVLAAYVVAFPLMYRAAIGALEQVDMALVQAARTLGAGEWRILRTVLIPAAGPGLLAGVTLSFARALGEFGATLLLAGNLPGRTQTLPVALYFDVEAGRWGRAALWVAVTLVFAAAAMAVLHVATRRPAQTGVLPPDVLPTDSPAAAYLPLPPPARTQGELEVAVQHHLPSFTLQVNCQLRQQSVCVLGPSGAGKTMLLHALAGLLQPQQSRIVLRGRTLTDSSAGVWVPPAQRRVALVPQQGALFPHMTVRQNVAYGVAQLPDGQRRQQVETALALFRIQRWAERRPGTLSGGQRQRVALARAWARQPDLLLLDEPFSALDAPLREGLQADWLHALQSFSGQCVLVSHDVQEAMRLAADLLLLEDGHVVAHGPSGQLLRQPPSKRAAELLGYRNLFAAQPSGPARVLVADWSEEVPVQAAVPSGTRWLGIREQGLQLSGQPGESAIACRLLQIEERLQDVLLLLQPGPIGAASPLYASLSYPEWQAVAGQPQPWWLTVPPDTCFCLEK